MNSHLDDKPLFPQDGGQISNSEDNTIKQPNAIIPTPEEERKNKLQKFSFNIVYAMLVSMGVVLGLSFLEKALKFDVPLLEEAFEVLKYSTTTILGYLFASKSE